MGAGKNPPQLAAALPVREQFAESRLRAVDVGELALPIYERVHRCCYWVSSLVNESEANLQFTEDGRDFAVTVPARVLSTDASLNRRLAIAGLGVTLSFESHLRDALERGQLVSILQEFCSPFPGYYLYYPQRRQASRVLRALIDHLQRWRRAGRSRKLGR